MLQRIIEQAGGSKTKFKIILSSARRSFEQDLIAEEMERRMDPSNRRETMEGTISEFLDLDDELKDDDDPESVMGQDKDDDDPPEVYFSEELEKGKELQEWRRARLQHEARKKKMAGTWDEGKYLALGTANWEVEWEEEVEMKYRELKRLTPRRKPMAGLEPTWTLPGNRIPHVVPWGPQFRVGVLPFSAHWDLC